MEHVCRRPNNFYRLQCHWGIESELCGVSWLATLRLLPAGDSEGQRCMAPADRQCCSSCPAGHPQLAGNAAEVYASSWQALLQLLPAGNQRARAWHEQSQMP